MKKILFIFVIGVMLLNFTSCSKKATPIVYKSPVENQNSDHLKTQGGSNLTLRTLYQYGIWIFCDIPTGNCLPEVVITANSSENLKNSANEFITSYNDSTVADFFSGTDYQYLFPDIDSLNGIVDSIVNGQIILHKFYNSHDTTDYFIGLPSGTIFTNDWGTLIPETRCVLRYQDVR